MELKSQMNLSSGNYECLYKWYEIHPIVKLYKLSYSYGLTNQLTVHHSSQTLIGCNNLFPYKQVYTVQVASSCVTTQCMNLQQEICNVSH